MINIITAKDRTITLTDEEMSLLLSAATMALGEADPDTVGYPEKTIDRVYKIAYTLLSRDLTAGVQSCSSVLIVDGVVYTGEEGVTA